MCRLKSQIFLEGFLSLRNDMLRLTSAGVSILQQSRTQMGQEDMEYLQHLTHGLPWYQEDWSFLWAKSAVIGTAEHKLWLRMELFSKLLQVL